jgi:CHAD domain-containing protein
VARAADIPGIAPDLSFREAAARAVAVRTEELFAHEDGVLDVRDIEGVHAMRVASRRLRAVLEIFAPCFPAKEHGKVLKAVKRLADALGERRDPDVAIESLGRIAEGLAAEDRHGVRSLADELRLRQLSANDELARELERLEQRSLRLRLVELAAAAHDPEEGLVA